MTSNHPFLDKHPIFLDQASQAVLDPIERLDVPIMQHRSELLAFIAGAKELDYYQLLGVLGEDFSDPECEWRIKDAADHLTDFINNATTDLEDDVIVGDRNTKDFAPGLGILNQEDKRIKHATDYVFEARNLLPFDNARDLYDADLGKQISKRLFENVSAMSDLQILGIPVNQLPEKSDAAVSFIERVGSLRLRQINLGASSLTSKDTVTKDECEVAAKLIAAASSNAIEEIKEASKAECSYQEFLDLVDIRGPVWEKVADILDVGLSDLQKIGRGTRKAVVSFARRHPGPLALFIAAELVAPKVYEGLPREVREKIQDKAKILRSRIETLVSEDLHEASIYMRSLVGDMSRKVRGRIAEIRFRIEAAFEN